MEYLDIGKLSSLALIFCNLIISGQRLLAIDSKIRPFFISKENETKRLIQLLNDELKKRFKPWLYSFIFLASCSITFFFFIKQIERPLWEGVIWSIICIGAWVITIIHILKYWGQFFLLGLRFMLFKYIYLFLGKGHKDIITRSLALIFLLSFFPPLFCINLVLLLILSHTQLNEYINELARISQNRINGNS